MPDGELDMDTLTIDADVSGTVPNYGPLDERTDMTNPETSTITIKDKTPLQVEPKTEAQVDEAVKAAITRDAGDEGLNPDEMFSVALEKLFTENMGYTADYDVTTTGDAVTAKQSGGNVEVNAMAVGMSTVKVTAKATMSASSATVSQTGADSAMVEFDVMVVNKKLMVTVMAEPMEIEEGGTSMITATVADRVVHADDGMVKIDLAVTGPATLSADSITIAAGGMNGSVTLTATDDDDYDDETVTVIASGSGITGQQSLTIMVTDPDEATPTVRAKTDAAEKIAAAIAKAAGGAEWMVGGMVAEVEMDGLFDLDEGVTATYQGTTDDADVVKAMTTGNTLMLTPMGAGMATITVTGADNAGGSEAAMVMHDATVVLANLTMMVTVEPMTVEEGGMATITAKASRMVAMADGMVKVNLSVVGDATLSAEMIEIKADSDTGTATLTSTDDEMHEPDGETVTLIASGAGIDGNMSFDIMVTDNDAEAPVDEATISAKEGAAAIIAAAITGASGGADWMVGGMAATVDEHVVQCRRRRHRGLLGCVERRRDRQGAEQRHDADPHADGGRHGHHHGDGQRRGQRQRGHRVSRCGGRSGEPDDDGNGRAHDGRRGRHGDDHRNGEPDGHDGRRHGQGESVGGGRCDALGRDDRDRWPIRTPARPR